MTPETFGAICFFSGLAILFVLAAKLIFFTFGLTPLLLFLAVILMLVGSVLLESYRW